MHAMLPGTLYRRDIGDLTMIDVVMRNLTTNRNGVARIIIDRIDNIVKFAYSNVPRVHRKTRVLFEPKPICRSAKRR